MESTADMINDLLGIPLGFLALFYESVYDFFFFFF